MWIRKQQHLGHEFQGEEATFTIGRLHSSLDDIENSARLTAVLNCVLVGLTNTNTMAMNDELHRRMQKRTRAGPNAAAGAGAGAAAAAAAVAAAF